MSRRPADWSDLGRHEDPAPGDPDAVADLARRYRRTADAVKRASSGLRRLADADDSVGKGPDKLRARARDLAEQVAKVHDRYAAAATALDGFHPQQHAAQLTADAALSRAREAKALRRRAEQTLRMLDRPVPAGEVEDPSVEQARAAARRELAHADAELGRARRDADRAHQEHDAAGRRAASALEDAVKSDGLNDSWKDDALGVVKQIAKVAGILASVLGVLSLFLGWVPVLGQVLMAMAALAALVSLLASFTLAASGKGSWWKVGEAALGLATLGIGRALMASGRLASVAARGRAWQHARTLVTGNSRSRYRQVRTLLGGNLAQADRAIPLATLGGLVRTGARAASPRTIAREAVEEVRRARTAWTGPQVAVDEVREAYRTFSGGSWKATGENLLGLKTPEVRAFDAIDDAVRNADEVLPAVQRAQAITRSAAGATVIGLGLDTNQLLPQGPDVDPAPVGPGRAPAGLPEGFVPPSPHLPPVPAR